MEQIEDAIFKTIGTSLQNWSSKFEFYTFSYVIVLGLIIMSVFTYLLESIIAINYDVKHNSLFLTIYTTYQIYGLFGSMKKIWKINAQQEELYYQIRDIKHINHINCKTCYVSKKKMCKFCKFWKKYHLKRKKLALIGLLKYIPKDIVRYNIWPLLKEN